MRVPAVIGTAATSISSCSSTTSISGSPNGMPKGRPANWPASLHLDVASLDDLAPSFGLGGDERLEFRRRHRGQIDTQLGEARLQVCIGDEGINLLAEPLDRLGGRAFRRSDAVPLARHIARHG